MNKHRGQSYTTEETVRRNGTQQYNQQTPRTDQKTVPRDHPDFPSITQLRPLRLFRIIIRCKWLWLQNERKIAIDQCIKPSYTRLTRLTTIQTSLTYATTLAARPRRPLCFIEWTFNCFLHVYGCCCANARQYGTKSSQQLHATVTVMGYWGHLLTIFLSENDCLVDNKRIASA